MKRRRQLATLLIMLACALPAIAQSSDETAKRFHVFPVLVDGGGWQSVLILTNVAQSASFCRLDLHGGLAVDLFQYAEGVTASGSTATFDLSGAGGYLVWRTKNASPLASGYATLDCGAPVVAQVLYASRDGSGTTTGMATVFSSQAGEGFQFPVLTPEATLGIAIANHTNTDASCRVVLEGPERQNLDQAPLPVPSKSNVVRFLYETIQIPDGFTEGSATVSCDQRVSVIGLQFDGDIFTTLHPPILDLPPQPSDETAKRFHVFPVLVDGGGWQSVLIVTNASQSTSLCTLELHGLTIDRFEDIGTTATGSNATFSLIAPAGYLVWPTRNELALALGYATLDCTDPVVAQVLYASKDGSGTTTGMATVFSSQAGGAFRFPVLTPEVKLGIAIANDMNTDASCRFVLESREHEYLGEATLPVASKSNVAQFLYEAIPIPDGFTEGSTTVSCDQQVSVVGLQFDGDIFTTLPPAIFDESPQTIIRGEAAPERAALEAFYDATGGPDWTHSTSWKTAAPLGQWYGVMVDESGRVMWLSLHGNNLSGAIPAELDNLSNLQSLNLSGNELSGTIPAELDNLSNLQSLNLSGNELSGTIPAELDNLSNLQSLNLSGNELSGTISAELDNLSNLQSLNLSGNELSGTIPAELGRLTRLRWLDLSDNELSGTIPPELSRLKLGRYGISRDVSTGHLDLSGNQLTGELPASLGLMAFVGRLHLYDNKLTGTLPASLTNLQHLSDFWFYDNAGLCAPTNASFQAWLDGIAIRSGPTCRNPFVTVNLPPETVEAIPAQTLAMRGFKALVDVSLYFRDPEGDPLIYAVESSNPAVVTALVAIDTGYRPLRWFMLLDQVAAGTATVTITARDTEGQAIRQTTAVTVKPEPHGLPEERAALEVFYESTDGPGWTRSTNWKTAAALGQWHGVTTDVEGRVIWLDLQGNSLSGAIPPELGNLTHLSYLALNGNELSETIPPELGNLARLVDMYIHHNQLTGELPASLTNLRQLRVFWFQDNAGLCVPTTKEFQDWMNEIKNRPPWSYPSYPGPKIWGLTCSPNSPDGGVGTVGQSFDLDPDNYSPVGLTFANGKFYVVNRSFEKKVYAYLASGQRVSAADFDLDPDSIGSAGIMYANGKFYVVDWVDEKVYAY